MTDESRVSRSGGSHRRTAEQAREDAIKSIMAVDVPGSGPLELVRREAEAIIAALGLSWPCNRCDRVSGDGICWFHNV